MNIKNLFNRFRKREPELSYSLNLIYLEDTKVVFNQNIQCAKDLENYLSAYMRLFGMYSDNALCTNLSGIQKQILGI